uniref:Uncharacterized protein n=1 Tax=Cafeteria roenbergensis TaxID=33653 RepID=A0A7S0JTC5_CAFRO
MPLPRKVEGVSCDTWRRCRCVLAETSSCGGDSRLGTRWLRPMQQPWEKQGPPRHTLAASTRNMPGFVDDAGAGIRGCCCLACRTSKVTGCQLPSKALFVDAVTTGEDPAHP